MGWLNNYLRRNVFTIASELLLVGSPYFHATTIDFAFGKPESTKFENLFELIFQLSDKLLDMVLAEIQAENMLQANMCGMVLSEVNARYMKHVRVYHQGIQNLNRQQFQKYLEDIEDTLDMLDAELNPSKPEGTVLSFVTPPATDAAK